MWGPPSTKPGVGLARSPYQIATSPGPRSRGFPSRDSAAFATSAPRRPALRQLERLGVLRLGLQHLAEQLERLRGLAQGLEGARELDARGVELGMEPQGPRQRGDRVVGVPLLELGGAEQVIEVRVARMGRQRFADQGRRPRRLAALDQPAESLEPLLERRVRELERAAQVNARLAPVGLLERRQATLEGARLLDLALAPQRPQRRQRLADQPL